MKPNFNGIPRVIVRLAASLCLVLSLGFSVSHVSAEQAVKKAQKQSSDFPTARADEGQAGNRSSSAKKATASGPTQRMEKAAANPALNGKPSKPAASDENSKLESTGLDSGDHGKSDLPKNDKKQAAIEKGQEQNSSEGELFFDTKKPIGAIALAREMQSHLVFRARVDTGAKSCSIHADEIVISEPAKSMKDNIGKTVRIRIKNQKDESEWVETQIHRLVKVKTSERAEKRYAVHLVLAYSDCEKEVSVTLNDRSEMVYPLLLGRNFLMDDFVVDVTMPEP